VAISPGAGISGGQLKDILVVIAKAQTVLTTKWRQQPKKVGGNRKMNGIESSVMPFVSPVRFGGIAGFLVGFALKRKKSDKPFENIFVFGVTNNW
jgi:hypothetical protein